MTHIDSKFWNGTRWNGHSAFKTISHVHVNCYIPAEGHDTCDIMAVEMSDGRWYVEDNWGGDANGAEGVWDPFKPEADLPRFFATEDEAIRHAVTVVAAVSGVDREELMRVYLDEDS
jgi:hypothetical protein